MKKNGDYDVGYGKPPAHTQFVKGQSGNPSGRRARQLTLDELIAQEVRKKVTIVENGQPMRITKKQAIAMRCVQRAMQGDAKAQKQVLDSLRQLETPTFGERQIEVTLVLEEPVTPAQAYPSWQNRD